MTHSSLKWLISHFRRYYAWVGPLWKNHLFLLDVPRRTGADTFPLISTLLKMYEWASFCAQTLDQDKSEALFSKRDETSFLCRHLQESCWPQLWLVWGILGKELWMLVGFSSNVKTWQSFRKSSVVGETSSSLFHVPSAINWWAMFGKKQQSKTNNCNKCSIKTFESQSCNFFPSCQVLFIHLFILWLHCYKADQIDWT